MSTDPITIPVPGPTVRPRFLSEAECHDIANRLTRFSRGGYTAVTIVSRWLGYVRYARNRVTTSGEVRTTDVLVGRNLRGAINPRVHVNAIDDATLVAAARRAERLAQMKAEQSEYDLALQYQPEPYATPSLFFESTYQLDAGGRAAAAHELVRSAQTAGMLAAGYIQVSAHSLAYINTAMNYARYFPYTWAQYTVTVRDPKGTGSGWAGVDWPDWSRIDGAQLSQVALEKCLTSRNPVAVEPGRYTTILEPQAVSDFIGQLMFQTGGNSPMELGVFTQEGNETWREAPFYKRQGTQVIDPRLTIRADPMDPELGFPPFPGAHNMLNSFSPVQQVFHGVTWIDHGVLTNLAYEHVDAIREYGQTQGQVNSGAFRMDVAGATATVAEMIATTKRGLLVTRFDGVEQLSMPSLLYRGVTRDGLWLIENGKISKPVKNMYFTESVLFALNNVEQVGAPQRVFHAPPAWAWWAIPQPAIVSALQVRDFSFTALSDAI